MASKKSRNRSTTGSLVMGCGSCGHRFKAWSVGDLWTESEPLLDGNSLTPTLLKSFSSLGDTSDRGTAPAVLDEAR